MSDDLRRAILARVADLRQGTTCCPSEIARDLAGDWRPLMAPLREAAFGLAAEGRIVVTQRGASVGPDTKGPIRLGPIGRAENVSASE